MISHHATRSARQNAWYWAVILPTIGAALGAHPADLHEYCKLRFNPVQDAAGTFGGSTAAMDTAQFGAYCDAIRRWAWQTWQLDIPTPAYASAA